MLAPLSDDRIDQSFGGEYVKVVTLTKALQQPNILTQVTR